MKKIVFAIQMIALILMIPVYVVVELNRETINSPVKNSFQEMKETIKPAKTNVQTAVDESEDGMFVFRLNAGTIGQRNQGL